MLKDSFKKLLASDDEEQSENENNTAGFLKVKVKSADQKVRKYKFLQNLHLVSGKTIEHFIRCSVYPFRFDIWAKMINHLICISFVFIIKCRLKKKKNTLNG